MYISSNKIRFKNLLIFGSIYLFIGIISALISNPLKDSTMQVALRLTALLASIIVFVVHIRFELKLNSPIQSAINTSLAVAIGIFALAVLANIYAFFSSTNDASLLLALLLWPVITGLLSFIAAYIILSIIKKVSRRG